MAYNRLGIWSTNVASLSLGVGLSGLVPGPLTSHPASLHPVSAGGGRVRLSSSTESQGQQMSPERPSDVNAAGYVQVVLFLREDEVWDPAAIGVLSRDPAKSMGHLFSFELLTTGGCADAREPVTDHLPQVPQLGKGPRRAAL